MRYVSWRASCKYLWCSVCCRAEMGGEIPAAMKWADKENRKTPVHFCGNVLFMYFMYWMYFIQVAGKHHLPCWYLHQYLCSNAKMALAILFFFPEKMQLVCFLSPSFQKWCFSCEADFKFVSPVGFSSCKSCGKGQPARKAGVGALRGRGAAPATLAEDPQQRQLQETRLHQFRGTQNQLFLLQHPGSKLYYFCLPSSNLVVSGGVMHLAKGALRCCGHEDIGDQKKP